MKELSVWKNTLETDLSLVSEEIKAKIKTPAVIILSGEVGAGKTTFTKYFIGQGEVVSPTYSLVNEIGEYVHADLYRLKGPQDLDHLELSLYMDDKKYALIEWGRPFLSELYSYLDESFNYYLLEFELLDDAKTRTLKLFSGVV